MQVNGEVGREPSIVLNQAEADGKPNEAEATRIRKITVQLSDGIFQRLEAATDRPGVGKSMVVETALERFLDPAPPVEDLIHEALDRIGGQMSRLESEVAIIAETVALHARYHLTVTPPMPQSQQRQACVIGHERFVALAEQVEQRVRLGRPLMRETIDRLEHGGRAVPEIDGRALQDTRQELVDRAAIAAATVGENSELHAAAGEGGSNPNFRHLPNAFC